MRRSLAVFLLFLAVACLALFRRADRARLPVPPPLEIPQSTPQEVTATIRVSLANGPARQATLAIDGPYRIRLLRPANAARGTTHAQPLVPAQVTRTDGRFQIGQETVHAAELELIPDQPPAIWVDDHQYRGTVRLIGQNDDRFWVVNDVRLEHYLASVVDSEMPAAFPDAARRAQAIVARTYALYQMQTGNPGAPFDVYGSTRNQKYLGFQYRAEDGRRLAGESEDSRRIVRETARLVCLDRGQLFATYYSAVCGGRTARGLEIFPDAASPLQSVECRWCQPARLYRWTTRLTKAEAAQRLETYLSAVRRPFGRLKSIRRVASRPGQTVPQFEVSDGRQRYYVSAVDLRRQLPPASLLSPQFDVQDAGDEFVFRGRGHGHGVGMCQWGARGLALAGKSGLEIIRYYYPGAIVVPARGDLLAKRPERTSSSVPLTEE